MAAEESARFTKDGASRVTTDVLDQLSADIRWLSHEFLSRPPYVVFGQLAALRRDVFSLVDNRPSPKYLRQLYLIAGQLSALLAHASSDLGHGYAADTHARTAWLCSEMAEDVSMRPYIRWVQAQVAYWRGDYSSAAELARNGRTYAATGSALLRTACQEARACAITGDGRDVDRALAIATEARHRAVNEPTPFGVFDFPAGKAAYYASEAWFALGGNVNYRKAAEEAGNALTLLEGTTAPELAAAAGLDLVAARVQLRDLDGAQDCIGTVLALPSESRTLPIIKRMVRIRTALDVGEYAKSAIANDLREQAELFTAYPAMRELPDVGS